MTVKKTGASARPGRWSANLLDLCLVLFGAVVVLALYREAADFYELPFGQRVDHPRYDALHPGGSIGRWLGAGAVLLFFFNLLYLPRRRLRVLRRWLSLRAWMSTHVFFGLLGGGLVALHSAFRLSSEAAQYATWSLVGLLATGVVGRYLYALVPHTARGEEEPEGFAGRAEACLAEIRALLPEGDPLVARIRDLSAVDRPPERVLLRAIVRLPLEPLVHLVGRMRLLLLLGGDAVDSARRSEVRSLAVQAFRAGHARQLAGAAARILRSWRLLHLALALGMAWSAWKHIESAFSHGFGVPLPDPLWPWLLGCSVPLVTLLTWEIVWRRRHRRKKVDIKLGDDPPPEPPPTLHPYVDPNICMGSAACISACPEGDILGLQDGRSRLVGPSHCIGHGECARNCPVSAITLVFGTMKRGVDIPEVSRYFESSVPGVYLIGELTGMGLIRNAVRQANDAIAHLVRTRRADRKALPEDMVDVCIVGAGPAGIAASLACMEAGLSTVTLEQAPDIGGAVRAYPRRKLVMTAPMELGLVGKVKLYDVYKEELVELWQKIQRDTGLEVRHGVRVESLEPDESGQGFVVRGGGQSVRARRVVLSVGRRGTPRRLGIPGEGDPGVVYGLIDAAQYRGRSVAVVGGGDSALEAALALAEGGATAVHVVYRGAAFDRARERNRASLRDATETANVQVHLSANPVSFDPDEGLRIDAPDTCLPVTDVIVCIGGILPTGLLRAAGVEVTRHFGRPL